MSFSGAGILLGVHDVRRRLQEGQRTVLLDVRWALGDPHGLDRYREAHLPGAVYVDLESELSAPASAADGRHPLPAPAALQQSARRWGINQDEVVVAYDDAGNTASARLWWLLRHAGFPSVHLLDGGLAAWLHAGYPVQKGEERPEPGTVELGTGHMPLAGLREVQNRSADTVLLDARAAGRYRGEHEPVDPRAGHIPGAKSLPTTGNLGTDGRFRPVEELRCTFASAGVDPDSPVIVYCGSGVAAAHQVAALAIAGYPAALYPGSWSQWSARSELPAATGAEP